MVDYLYNRLIQMSQKFRVQEMRIKSWTANRSWLVTENMTSATADQVIGTTFKNVQVNENGEFVVWPSWGWSSWLTYTINATSPSSPSVWDYRETLWGVISVWSWSIWEVLYEPQIYSRFRMFW